MTDTGIVVNFAVLTFLALFIAFNPALIILNLVLVLKSERPIRDSLVLAFGVVLPWIIVFTAAVFWLKPDSVLQLRGSFPDIDIPAAIEIVFGISLLIYASRRRFRAAHAPNRKGIIEKAKKIIVSPGSIFSFGLIKSSLSITNLLALLVIVRLLVVNDAGPSLIVVTFLYVIAIGLAPLLIQPYLYKKHPESLRTAEDRVRHALVRGSEFINLILVISGAGFLIHGFIQAIGG